MLGQRCQQHNQMSETPWVKGQGGRVFLYQSEFAIKFMHIAMLVSIKELSESIPKLGHLSKALMFCSAITFLASAN